MRDNPTLADLRGAPSPLTAERPEVPWSDIARMHDLIGHRYYRLIGQPLDRLRDACHELLTAVQADEEPPP